MFKINLCCAFQLCYRGQFLPGSCIEWFSDLHKAVLGAVGKTVESIFSKTLACNFLCTLELCTGSMIATSYLRQLGATSFVRQLGAYLFNV